MADVPEMNPEMYMNLEGGEEQPPAQQPPSQPVSPAQHPQAVPPAQQPPTQDLQQDGVDVQTARQMLGLDRTEQTVEQLQQELMQVKMERVRNQMAQKYPDVPFEIVEKEIEKLEAINPGLADAMRTTEDGMEMAYRAALASLKPKEEPDNLTEGEGGGEEKTSLEELVKEGKADDFSLGEYILGRE